MKVVKSFKDFYNKIILEKYSIGRYQRELQKFYKNSNIELHTTLTYNTSLTTLVQVINKLINYPLEKVIMLTMFSVSILTHESKGKTEKLYAYLLKNDLNDEDINNVLNQLKNINKLYNTFFSKKDGTFIDLLEDTNQLIPFLFVIEKLISTDLLNGEMLSNPEEFLDDEKYQILINRIVHRYKIISGNNSKFQNKDNIKPLKVNDEFKSPMYKTVDTIIKE